MFSIEYSLDKADYKAWFSYAYKHNVNNLTRNSKLMFLAGMTLAFFSLLILNYNKSYSYDANKLWLLLASYIVAVIIINIALPFIFKLNTSFNTRNVVKNNPRYNINIKTTFDENIVTVSNELSNSEIKYDAFFGLYEDLEHLYLMLSKNSALIVPKKCFKSEEVDFVKTKIEIIKSLKYKF